MENIVTEIAISMVCGSVGGSVAGSLLKKSDFGPLASTLIGVIGGGITLLLLNLTGLLLIPATLSGTLLEVLGDACGSVLGGGTLLAIVGLIRNAVVRKTA